MNKKLASVIICLPVLVGLLFSAVVLSEISVGVKQGDWIEYQISTVGAVPPEHDVEGAKIEVLAVEGETIDVKFTSKFSNGTEDVVTSTLNLVTGQIGDAFIIPANLNVGDTFLEQSEGSITLSGVEERTFAGARRTVVYASTSVTMFYWDRSTGVLVEAKTSTSNFTLTTRAEKTNIWQAQIFGLDPVIIIVLIIVVVAAVSAIFLIFRKRK